MVQIKKLVLDVLKPLKPSILDFAMHLSQSLPNTEIQVHVSGVDEKTQDVVVTLHGDLEFEKIDSLITDLGASIHSIDEVITVNADSSTQQTD